MKVLVFNGWAAGHETWDLCAFPHDWVFSYLEQLDGLPERVLDDSDEVLLVGFSMGGVSALKLLMRSPEKVRGLVLVSTTPRMMEERRRKAKGEGEEVVWKGLSPRRLAALKFGTEMLFREDPSPIYAAANLNRGLEFLQAHDLREQLRQFVAAHPCTFPVAVFHSERDGVVRPHNPAFFQAVFPQAVVTMVPGNEHVLPVTVPELIDAAVKGMLTRS